MVEHAVQNHLHSTPVNLLHKFREEAVAGLQIPRGGGADHVFFSVSVIHGVRRHQTVLILHDHAEMGIDVLVILNVVLVVGGGHKNGI